jgi:hypothetical protein
MVSFQHRLVRDAINANAKITSFAAFRIWSFGSRRIGSNILFNHVSDLNKLSSITNTSGNDEGRIQSGKVNNFQ